MWDGWTCQRGQMHRFRWKEEQMQLTEPHTAITEMRREMELASAKPGLTAHRHADSWYYADATKYSSFFTAQSLYGG